MTAWLFVAAALVTVMAGVRSTWSPCGLSMLASITPLSEVGRGHRFRTTAWWYAVGSTVGGATLGTFTALLAVAADALSLTPHEVILLALGTSVAAIASDSDLVGFHLPVHHRQVNERWLDRLRPWAYGAGFGWQIGTGLATYIMTAGVYLMIVLAALTREPWLAAGFGVLFGLARGMSVFLGRHITTTDALRAFHARFYGLGPTVRRCMVAVEALATTLFAWLLSPWAGLALVGIAGIGSVARIPRRWRGSHPAESTEFVPQRSAVGIGNE